VEDAPRAIFVFLKGSIFELQVIKARSSASLIDKLIRIGVTQQNKLG
jgi:hypothetical protein